MFHAYGQIVIMLFGLMSGHKIVTLPKFEPEVFLTTIQKYQVKVLDGCLLIWCNDLKHLVGKIVLKTYFRAILNLYPRHLIWSRSVRN